MNLNPNHGVPEGKPPMEPLRTEQPIDLAQKAIITTSNICPVTNQTLQVPSTHAVPIHAPNLIDGSKLNFTVRFRTLQFYRN